MTHLDTLAMNLRHGVHLRNYRRLFRVHRNCFYGIDAVKFFVESGAAMDERDAVLLGRKLLRCGYLRHVTNEHDFLNEKELYRCMEDDQDVQPVGLVFAADLDDGEAREIMELLKKNVRVKGRRRRLVFHKNCFLGKDAVRVLAENGIVQNEAEALSVGQALLEGGYFCHVSNSRPFENRDYLYRFADDWSQADDLEMEVMIERAQAEFSVRSNSWGGYERPGIVGEDLLAWMIECGFVSDDSGALEVASLWLETGIMYGEAMMLNFDRLEIYRIVGNEADRRFPRSRSRSMHRILSSRSMHRRLSSSFIHRKPERYTRLQSQLSHLGGFMDHAIDFETRALDSLSRPMDNLNDASATMSKVSSDDSSSRKSSTSAATLQWGADQKVLANTSGAMSMDNVLPSNATSDGSQTLDCVHLKQMRHRGINPVPSLDAGDLYLAADEDQTYPKSVKRGVHKKFGSSLKLGDSFLVKPDKAKATQSLSLQDLFADMNRPRLPAQSLTAVLHRWTTSNPMQEGDL